MNKSEGNNYDYCLDIYNSLYFVTYSMKNLFKARVIANLLDKSPASSTLSPLA